MNANDKALLLQYIDIVLTYFPEHTSICLMRVDHFMRFGQRTQAYRNTRDQVGIHLDQLRHKHLASKAVRSNKARSNRPDLPRVIQTLRAGDIDHVVLETLRKKGRE